MRSPLLLLPFALLAVTVAAPAAAQQPGQIQVTVPWPLPVPLPVPVPMAQPSQPPEPPPLPAPPPEPMPVFELPPGPPPAPPPQMKLRSGVSLAEDVSLAFPVRSPDTRSAGYGLDTRIGYRFAAGPLFFSPEALLGWVQFPKWEAAVRFGAGGRVGVDAGLVEPSIYAFGGGFWNLWKSGTGVRAGAALDFRPGRWFAPGIHVDYNTASWETGSVKYVGVGAHMGFVLGRRER
jgi:hypothetical protein